VGARARGSVAVVETTAGTNAFHRFSIGRDLVSPYGFFVGKIDEIRVSDVVRELLPVPVPESTWGAIKARWLDPIERLAGLDGSNVPRVQRGGGLEEKDVSLFIGDRTMLDAARNDDELALADIDRMLAKLHPELSLDHQEELVLVLVEMPIEWSLELDQLDQLTVELADDLRRPVLVEERQLLG
jgi:hypothetical protein